MKTDWISGGTSGLTFCRGMSRVSAMFLAALMLILSADPSSAQSRKNRDAELGALPPPPDLRQDSEKSFFERMKARRIALQKAKAEEDEKERAATRRSSGSAPKDEPLAKRLPQKVERPPQDPNAPPPEFKTSSGNRLRSFSEPGFWQDADAPPVEETIATLPAMPDLRTDSQKSWFERYRDKQRKIKKVKEARAKLLAERAEQRKLGEAAARQKAAEAANRPKPPEPVYYAYNGAPIQPETPTGNELKAFGRNSRYVKDQQVVFQGQPPESEGLQWLKRGLNPNPKELGPEDSKWEWRNPFAPDSPGPTDTFEITPLDGSSAGVLEGDVGASDTVDASAPLVSSLIGIRIVPKTRDVKEGPMTGITGIVNDLGVLLPVKVARVLERYLGQPMSLASLNQMVREAIIAYRDSDYPVIDVLVPQQEVTQGVLQLVVIEGRVGEVIAEGNEYTTSEYLQNEIRLQRGQIIRESILMEDLAWINKNPFRRVDLIYSPGADYGTTDLILRTEDISPLTFYVGYEDSGTELLGQDRLLAGVNWGGPLFLSTDSVVSYQYSTDLDGDADLKGHTGIFTSHLPWRHVLTLLGATVSSDAEVIIGGEKIIIGGVNRQVGGRYAIPLPAFSSFTQELELGVDIKSSNSDLFFGGLEVFDTTTEIVQFAGGYNVSQRDPLGQTRLSTDVVWSPGNITAGNDDKTFASQRALSSAEYIYGRLRLDRSVELPAEWSILARAEGQISNSNLLGSETLGAGGYDTVRGFEQRIVRGDNGIVASIELRSPTMSLAGWSGFYNARDALVALAFFDYAYLTSTDKLPDEEDISLSSWGFGLRYQLDKHLTVRLDYGWQIDEQGFDDGEDGRVHIGARATF